MRYRCNRSSRGGWYFSDLRLLAEAAVEENIGRVGDSCKKDDEHILSAMLLRLSP